MLTAEQWVDLSVGIVPSIVTAGLGLFAVVFQNSRHKKEVARLQQELSRHEEAESLVKASRLERQRNKVNGIRGICSELSRLEGIANDHFDAIPRLKKDADRTGIKIVTDNILWTIATHTRIPDGLVVALQNVGDEGRALLDWDDTLSLLAEREAFTTVREQTRAEIRAAQEIAREWLEVEERKLD